MTITKKTLTLLLAFLPFLISAQNLVPNPSFENYGSLPCGWIQSASGFDAAMQNWIMPTDGTSDVFSTLVGQNCYAHCFSTSSASPGQQAPRTGEVMSAILTYGNGCGFQPDYREYLAIELTQPLQVGENYYAEIWVSHADNSQEASNNIGMHFSETLITDYSTCQELSLVPQINETNIITENQDWVKVSGSFVATTPAKFLTIGNFYTNANTQFIIDNTKPSINARYFIDDVTVEQKCGFSEQDLELCQGDPITLEILSSDVIGWAVDTMPGVLISTDPILTVNPIDTTTYIAYFSCDTIAYTVFVNPPPVLELGTDTTLCEGETLTLNPDLPNGTYEWQDNSTNSQFTVSSAGIYWVNAISNACALTDTIQVDFNPLPIVELGNDTTICFGDVITLFANYPDATYEWDNGSTSDSLNVSSPGTYSVLVTALGCSYSESINIDNFPEITVQFGSDTTLCEGDSLILDATNPNATYTWQDGSTNPSLEVTEPGFYDVQINSNDCPAYFSIDVAYLSAPDFDLGADTSICFGSELILMVPEDENFSYLWSDNSTSSSLEVLESGIYSVTVSNICGSLTDQIMIERKMEENPFQIPNAFTPDQDGMNDTFVIIRDEDFTIFEYNMKIYNRWGKLVYEGTDPDNGWNGWKEDKAYQSEVYVYRIFIDYLNCEGEQEQKIFEGDLTLLR